MKQIIVAFTIALILSACSNPQNLNGADSFDRDDDPTTERSFEETGDYDCSDFTYQSEAQDFFENEGGSSGDYHNLDRDSDGAACETLP
ncbi:MAG: membrane lipoprotein lipid attachment site-containing protein [Candidatus Curtissbacteria bacterium]|nr:membrane lipoprotein lipid attachment site-containing protein [Candidatus Curtissbacteria bacterium]